MSVLSFYISSFLFFVLPFFLFLQLFPPHGYLPQDHEPVQTDWLKVWYLAKEPTNHQLWLVACLGTCIMGRLFKKKKKLDFILRSNMPHAGVNRHMDRRRRRDEDRPVRRTHKTGLVSPDRPPGELRTVYCRYDKLWRWRVLLAAAYIRGKHKMPAKWISRHLICWSFLFCLPAIMPCSPH